ncbi:hypothetical protein [Bifidobacterium biavatii]|uniref:ATP-dependent serine Clp protease n=1 Tax=Bifidobacterium biavatii DSM 23969 TaxID=1437608 RepID=A0A086ZDU9_9BIFI|nr:hypothetical protein [Bifidobacterium biavatii]KFI44699.1 ATP-dependent serine Clp protease [Bifidobacterium biavatii DSM 23969]
MTTTDLATIDFDNWTDQQEQDAINQLAKQSRPRHIIGGNQFIAEFPDKKRVTLPLTLSLADINAMTQNNEDDAVQQVITLLERLGDKKTVDTITTEPVASMAAIASDYFETIQKITGATMGK